MTTNNILGASVLAVLLAVLPISAIACPCSEPAPSTTTEEEEPKQNG